MTAETRTAEARTAGDERGARPEGREGRNENRRGPRPEREPRRPAPVEGVTEEAAVAAGAFVDTVPGTDTADAGGEVREGGRRRRRGRGGRDRDEARQAVNGDVAVEAGAASADAADGFHAVALPPDADAAPVSGHAAPVGEDGAVPAEGGEREGGRRRRGRGRDRQRREDDITRGADGVADEPVTSANDAVAHDEAASAPVEAADVTQPFVHVAVEPARIEEPQAPAPVVVSVEAAPVEAFVLPTNQLQAVAEAAGLQWVNSDVDKIRAVQDAMANEPKPIHAPREPKPVVAVDEGPLVLVETRKDLTQFKLPFEATRDSQSQP